MNIPEEFFPVVDSGLRFEPRKVNLNPYLFGGRYAGSFVRLSKESVINVSVGGGMVFAGTTGICGMALLLQKMPWNQRAAGPR